MKSHVSIGHYTCPICMENHNKAVILDRRLQNTFEDKAYSFGFALCDKHKSMYADGYIALIGVDQDEKRTGDVCHIREEVFKELFKNLNKAPMYFCDQLVIDKLLEKTEKCVHH